MAPASDLRNGPYVWSRSSELRVQEGKVRPQPQSSPQSSLLCALRRDRLSDCEVATYACELASYRIASPVAVRAEIGEGADRLISRAARTCSVERQRG